MKYFSYMLCKMGIHKYYALWDTKEYREFIGVHRMRVSSVSVWGQCERCGHCVYIDNYLRKHHYNNGRDMIDNHPEAKFNELRHQPHI